MLFRSLPTHHTLDAANEKALDNMKIGSTLKDIGPTYTDKTARKDLRTLYPALFRRDERS